jgi:folate-dependent phosphoribosylglycinamide formyltransferase PurN
MTDQRDYSREEDLLNRLLSKNPGRTIARPEGAAWGHLILPAPDENPHRPKSGTRVLFIGSWVLGMLGLQGVKKAVRENPGRLNLVTLVTDDPLDPAAKISVHKRFWRYYSEQTREDYELSILEEALTFGVPCYTGEVKNAMFRGLLADWDPEIIVVCAFGQLIDRKIIDRPRLGIYNVHPSDLLHHFGAGPQPWEDIVARKATTNRTSLHWVSETIDEGSVVGQSPPINVALPDGQPCDDVMLIGEKSMVVVPRMVEELLRQLLVRKKSGESGPIAAIDFEQAFTASERDELMQPIDPGRFGKLLALPAGA